MVGANGAKLFAVRWRRPLLTVDSREFSHARVHDKFTNWYVLFWYHRVHEVNVTVFLGVKRGRTFPGDGNTKSFHEENDLDYFNL